MKVGANALKNKLKFEDRWWICGYRGEKGRRRLGMKNDLIYSEEFYLQAESSC